MTTSDHVRLDIAIVGGGLIGSVVARVLREQHNVTIYERAKTSSEFGAALGLGPTATLILEELGLKNEHVKGVSLDITQVWGKNGKVVFERDMRAVRKQLGIKGEYILAHRRDWHNEFLRLATAPSEELGIQGQPAKIIFGKEVVDVDPEKGELVFGDGTKVQADLIVAADGIKSVLRPFVVGDAAYTTARPSGLTAFRYTLPREEVIAAHDGKVPPMLQADKPPLMTIVDAQDGSRRYVNMYACRDFELLNVVCMVPDSSLKSPTPESWTATGDKKELLSHFDDFPDWLKVYMDIAEDHPKMWQLRDQDPLPSYVRGRMVLVGDAAHPMTPHQGQGATQGIEDAEAFRLFLSRYTLRPVTRGGVSDILKDIDSVRRPRASQIQTHTRQIGKGFTTGDVFRYDRFNWRYPGIVEGVRRVQRGEPVQEL